MFKHILVPTDGSASSEMAIQSAMRLARDIRARVTGLHVLPALLARADVAEPPRDALAQTATDNELQAQRFLLAIEQYAREYGVPCETLCVKSDGVHEAIIQIAFERQCDLVAMASHGCKGVRALLLGSETQQVLTHSQVPVLVFR